MVILLAVDEPSYWFRGSIWSSSSTLRVGPVHGPVRCSKSLESSLINSEGVGVAGATEFMVLLIPITIASPCTQHNKAFKKGKSFYPLKVSRDFSLGFDGVLGLFVGSVWLFVLLVSSFDSLNS